MQWAVLYANKSPRDEGILKSISLKKVLSIIVCLLCVALSAIAGPIHVSASMNYSSTYKGSGRAHYGYSARPMHSNMTSAGLAQAPSMTMSSTTSSMGRGITMSNASMTAAPQVRGIYTAASQVTGGVTTEDTYSPARGPRKIGGRHPGECPDCVDGDRDGVCDICECELYACECDDCRCPLDFNAAVALFMALLAGAYAFNKVRAHDSI